MVGDAIKRIWHNRDLCLKIAQRDVLSRYKGSALGVLWPFIQQLLMLVAYTIVFGYVFKSRWPGLDGDPVRLAIVIYSGLVSFNFFSEVVNKSATVIVNNTNYVKRVVFPLEILPVSVAIAAISNYMIGLFLLVIVEVVFGAGVDWSIFITIPIVFPILIMSIGLGYIISSTCLFVRDVEQVVLFLTSLLLFATPVFYPVTALPESVRWIVADSPLVFAVNSVRGIIVYSELPSIDVYFIQLMLSVLVFLFGLGWFERLKKGFADVV